LDPNSKKQVHICPLSEKCNLWATCPTRFYRGHRAEAQKANEEEHARKLQRRALKKSEKEARRMQSQEERLLEKLEEIHKHADTKIFVVEYNQAKAKITCSPSEITQMKDLAGAIQSKFQIDPNLQLVIKYHDKQEDAFLLLTSLEELGSFTKVELLVTSQMPVLGSLDNIQILKSLSSGHFGSVYEALWQKTTTVALKTLFESEKEAFVAEMEILKTLKHPNIVAYLGTCVIDGKYYLVMEHLALGNARDLLENNKDTITTLQILGMARDSASGMNYISSRNIIHRDLAARNLLIKREGTDYLVKVGDFGMSRVMMSGNDYVSSTKIFARQWAAPEVIEHRKFSSASDVFSFGTTLWELFEYGKVPFCDCSTSEAAERIMQGNMLPQPKYCPDEIYKLIQKCWIRNPLERPSFTQAFEIIQNCLLRMNPAMTCYEPLESDSPPGYYS